MMTSQNHTRLIEKYLIGTLTPVDKIIFESRLVLDPNLRRNLYFQKKTYKLIKMYHREKLKEEMEALHQKLFNDPEKINLRKNIYQLFK